VAGAELILESYLTVCADCLEASATDVCGVWSRKPVLQNFLLNQCSEAGVQHFVRTAQPEASGTCFLKPGINNILEPALSGACSTSNMSVASVSVNL
jgi:hypothetical protein